VGLATALVAVCLSGCGSEAPAPRAAAPPSASQLLARSESALDRVRTFRLLVSGGDARGVLFRMSADVALPGRFKLSFVDGADRYSLRLVGAYGYLKGNARYWVSAGVPDDRAGAVAGRWIKVPASSLPASVRYLASPTMLARCMIGLSNGTVTSRGTSQEKLGPVVILDQRARPPSSTLRTVFISARAPWLPVMASQQGPDDPPDQACGETAASATAIATATEYFSRYDLPVHVVAPPRALSLQAAQETITTRGLRPGASGNTTPNAEQSQAALLNGTWIATGKFVSVHNFFGAEQVGTIFQRVWRFDSGCSAQVCQVTIDRSTNGGPLIAGLGWDRGHWTVTFDNTATCSDRSVHSSTDHMTLSLKGSTLTAVEHAGSGTACGSIASSVTLWTAHKEPSPDTPPIA
jgi:hypothetical protein